MKQIPFLIIISCWAITIHAQKAENSSISDNHTKEDSLRLPASVGEDKPIWINPAARQELEQLFGQGMLSAHSDDSWKKFIISTIPKVSVKSFQVATCRVFPVSKTLLSDKALLKYESLRIGKFYLQSHWESNGLKAVAYRTSNLDIPLIRRLRFYVGGNYGVSQKHSPILPVFIFPYQLDAGFSYHIKKNLQLKSGCTYRYNVITKRWEWCFTMGVSLFY